MQTWLTRDHIQDLQPPQFRAVSISCFEVENNNRCPAYEKDIPNEIPASDQVVTEDVLY